MGKASARTFSNKVFMLAICLFVVPMMTRDQSKFNSNYCRDHEVFYLDEKKCIWAEWLQKRCGWKQAREMCLSSDGDLVQPSNKKKNDFITKNFIIGISIDKYWIGLFFGNHSQWVWADNTTSFGGYTNWGVKTKSLVGKCAAYKDDPHWEQFDCNMKAKALCERKYETEKTPESSNDNYGIYATIALFVFAASFFILLAFVVGNSSKKRKKKTIFGAKKTVHGGAHFTHTTNQQTSPPIQCRPASLEEEMELIKDTQDASSKTDSRRMSAFRASMAEHAATEASAASKQTGHDTIETRTGKSIETAMVFRYLSSPLVNQSYRSLNKTWSSCNRIRSKYGRTAAKLHQWGYQQTPNCTLCHAPKQDMDHMILHCPETSIAGGYTTVHKADEDFNDWLTRTQLEL